MHVSPCHGRAYFPLPRVLLIFACFIFFLAINCVASNRIQTENAKTGTPDWVLNNPASQREIEGYASLTSVNIGANISFFVSTADPNYSIDIFRVGWYQGIGGKRVLHPVQRKGMLQTTPSPAPDSGLIECRWKSQFTLKVPQNWASGIYLAKLTASGGKQSYILFVVRDDERRSDILYQSSVTTFEAYNNWGGKSLYEWNSKGGKASKVSFNRPYAMGANPASAPGIGAADFITNLQPDDETKPAGWEINMVRFLEREGYDVTYSTNLDTHARGQNLRLHKAFVSVGHDEYWSREMRDHVEQARDAGVNLAFFSANTSYWQVRFEPSEISGAANRTMVCYKSADLDPLAKNPETASLRTIRWREVGRPEAAMIGVQFVADETNTDIVVSDATQWPFEHTGLKNGDKLKGLLGYEVDGISDASPSGTIALTSTPVLKKPNAASTIYVAPSGATVFATGSIQWSWGLDDYNAPSIRPSFVSPTVQLITRNVLDRFVKNFPEYGNKTKIYRP